jgi:hypothetical protein
MRSLHLQFRDVQRDASYTQAEVINPNKWQQVGFSWGCGSGEVRLLRNGSARVTHRRDHGGDYPPSTGGRREGAVWLPLRARPPTAAEVGSPAGDAAPPRRRAR